MPHILSSLSNSLSLTNQGVFFPLLSKGLSSSVSPLLLFIPWWELLQLFSLPPAAIIMSTVVYQGLQSCLETQQVEQRTLRLKLASPKPHFSQSIGLLDSNTKQTEEKCHYGEGGGKTNSPLDTHNSPSPDLGGWSFIHALSNGSQGQKEAMEKQCSYVHPLVKRSASTLSDKSLEMCTEDLGSETGTHVVENTMFAVPASASEPGDCPSRELLQSRQLLRATKANSQNFPPPLTTISGSNSLQIRPHREDGRLIMKAVKASLAHTLFQVERSEGRLRLCLLKDPTSNLDWQVAAQESEGSSDANEREEIENEEEKEEEDIEEEEEEEEEEVVEEEEEDGDEQDEEDGEFNWSEEMEGKNMEVGVEMGMEKYQRPSRCKEGGGHGRKGLLNWEPFWVTSS
uniref:FAF domain-containing protein n=1 Tax=Vitis vinifera TaxID=29760 RepID=F6HDM5_VITVI|eukprot:XP_002277799.3 PREDICTED: protein FANTASTIC FOUR 3 [Vitis vinifera]